MTRYEAHTGAMACGDNRDGTMSAKFTPGPEWALTGVQFFDGYNYDDRHIDDFPIYDRAPDLLKALEAAVGYMSNAKIDLECSTKAAAIRTLDGGLNIVREAIEALAKATQP